MHCTIRHHNTLATSRHLYPNQKQILIGWFRRHELRSPGEFQSCQHFFSAFVKTQHPEGEKTLVRDESLYSSYTSALSVFCLHSCPALPRWLASDECFQPSHQFHNLPLRFLLSSYIRSFCYMHSVLLKSIHASQNLCNANVAKSLAYCMLFTSSSDTNWTNEHYDVFCNVRNRVCIDIKGNNINTKPLKIQVVMVHGCIFKTKALWI